MMSAALRDQQQHRIFKATISLCCCCCVTFYTGEHLTEFVRVNCCLAARLESTVTGAWGGQAG